MNRSPARIGQGQALAAALVAASVLTQVLAGLSAANPRGEIGEKERALQQTHRQLREERTKAAEARRREASLLSELDQIDRRLAAKRRQVAELDRRVRQAQAHIAELSAEIGRLDTRRAGQQEALGRRLRAFYKLRGEGGAREGGVKTGGLATPPAIGEDPLDRAVRLRHLATLATVDARSIQEYRRSSEGLGDRKDRVEARQRELATLRNEAEAERAEADREAARRRALLAKVKGERAYHDRVVGELSEASRRLEAFIRDLQAKQRRAAATPKVAVPARPRPAPSEEPAGTGFGGLRGRLGWPVNGQVVGEFGAQVHPRFGTKTFRNGIDIAVPEGTGIVAVYPGHVVYTGWFRGYGNLIIVDHGGEYFTLYAHAAEIRVTEGDEVRQGQTIGTVGETGSLQGPRLYFEVRHQGRPQDPAQWLRPRG